MLNIQPDIPADFAGHNGVVTGEDFYGDTVFAQKPQCFGRGFLGRVEEGGEPGKDKTLLIGG